MTSRQWRPIAPLAAQPDHDFSADDDLRHQWLDRRSDAENANLTALHRSWAIETGIIEGIYHLDETQTGTLIKQGFEPEKIPQSGTVQDPDNLLVIRQDHMTALDAIYSEVRRGRSISLTAIRQLNQIIVSHQPTCRAMNQFGQRFDARLETGAFMRMPNNPTASSTSTARRNRSTPKSPTRYNAITLAQRGVVSTVFPLVLYNNLTGTRLTRPLMVAIFPAPLHETRIHFRYSSCTTSTSIHL